MLIRWLCRCPSALAGFGALLWVGLMSVGCQSPSASSPAASATTRTNLYAVKGVLKEIKPNGLTAVIDHEPIPGYMPAMTMPLNVKDKQDLAGVKPGDQIAFRMLVTADDGWIDQIQVLQPAGMGLPPTRPTTRLVRNVQPLKVGDYLPNYPFTNELGRAVSLGDHRGKAVAITFIFTRCPFPLFCPRMTDHFRRAYDQLEKDPQAPKNWQLFSLSFDVEFDTPPVLRAYAQRARYTPARWSFLTGALIEIDDITERFGMYFSRELGTFNFEHNLRTVVIDTRGRVHHIFIGNEWKVEELVAKLTEAARVPVTGEAPPPPRPAGGFE